MAKFFGRQVNQYEQENHQRVVNFHSGFYAARPRSDSKTDGHLIYLHSKKVSVMRIKQSIQDNLPVYVILGGMISAILLFGGWRYYNDTITPPSTTIIESQSPDTTN